MLKKVNLALLVSFLILLFCPQKLKAQVPQLEYVSNILDTANDVATSGNYAYVAGQLFAYTVNMTDPAHPVIADTFTKSGCVFYSVDVNGQTAYFGEKYFLCSQPNGLLVIDASNPNNLQQIGEFGVSGPGAISQIKIDGNYAYLANSNGGLTIINGSNPADMQQVGQYTADGADFRDVKIVNGKAYLADLNGNLWVLDVHDPTLPTLITKYHFLEAGNALGVDIQGNYAYIALRSQGLIVVNISDLYNINEVSHLSLSRFSEYANDIVVRNKYAYLADGDSIKVVNIDNPNNISEVSSYIINGNAIRLTEKDNYIYVADQIKGLYVFKFNGQPVSTDITLNVPLLKQTNPSWANLTYDSSNLQNLGCGATIGQCGCALTSAAMVLNYFGVTKDPLGRPTTPQTLNEYLNTRNSCDSKGCSSLGYSFGEIFWPAVGTFSAGSNKIFGTQKIELKRLPQLYSKATVLSDITNREPVILQRNDGKHWFVATGTLNNNSSFQINDPGTNKTKFTEYNDSARYTVTFKRTNSDFSNFSVVSKAPTQLVVTDSQGKRTGFDIKTNSIVEEIPNSIYFFQNSYLDPNDLNQSISDNSGIYTVMINTPDPQQFDVQTIDAISNKYGFAVYGTDVGGTTNLNIFENIQPVEGDTYT